MNKVAILHRALGMKPGEVPTWFFSTDCKGLDVLTAMEAVAAVSLFAILYRSYVSLAIAMLGLILFFLAIHIPFEACERGARARKRRGELI